MIGLKIEWNNNFRTCNGIVISETDISNGNYNYEVYSEDDDEVYLLTMNPKESGKTVSKVKSDIQGFLKYRFKKAGGNMKLQDFIAGLNDITSQDRVIQEVKSIVLGNIDNIYDKICKENEKSESKDDDHYDNEVKKGISNDTHNEVKNDSPRRHNTSFIHTIANATTTTTTTTTTISTLDTQKHNKKNNEAKAQDDNNSNKSHSSNKSHDENDDEDHSNTDDNSQNTESNENDDNDDNEDGDSSVYDSSCETTESYSLSYESGTERTGGTDTVTTDNKSTFNGSLSPHSSNFSPKGQYIQTNEHSYFPFTSLNIKVVIQSTTTTPTSNNNIPTLVPSINETRGFLIPDITKGYEYIVNTLKTDYQLLHSPTLTYKDADGDLIAIKGKVYYNQNIVIFKINDLFCLIV